MTATGKAPPTEGEVGCAESTGVRATAAAGAGRSPRSTADSPEGKPAKAAAVAKQQLQARRDRGAVRDVILPSI